MTSHPHHACVFVLVCALYYTLYDLGVGEVACGCQRFGLTNTQGCNESSRRVLSSFSTLSLHHLLVVIARKHTSSPRICDLWLVAILLCTLPPPGPPLTAFPPAFFISFLYVFLHPPPLFLASPVCTTVARSSEREHMWGWGESQLN